jgi:hypothetical protein
MEYGHKSKELRYIKTTEHVAVHYGQWRLTLGTPHISDLCTELYRCTQSECNSPHIHIHSHCTANVIHLTNSQIYAIHCTNSQIYAIHSSQIYAIPLTYSHIHPQHITH